MGVMKATARRQNGKFAHDLKVRDAPPARRRARGPRRRGHGPEPAGAARRLAGLLHGDHDARCTPSARAGTSTASRSTATTRPPSAAARRSSTSSCASPATLSDEQVERLQVIAAKCPVHRTLEGEVTFDERVELSLSDADRARAHPARRVLLDARRQADGHSTSTAERTPPSSSRSTSTTAARCTRVFTRRRDDLRRHPGEISFPGGRAGRQRRGPARRPPCARPQEEIGLPPEARRARRRPAAHADVRHELLDLSLRRASSSPGFAWVVAGRRGRRGPRAAAGDVRAGLRRAAASCAAASRSAPTTYEVGDDVIWGADGAAIVGATCCERARPPGATARGSPRFGRRSASALLDRDVDEVAPLGPRAVVVLDVAPCRAARAARTRCGPSARRCGSRR